MKKTDNIKANDNKWELDIAITYQLMGEQLNNEGAIGNYTQSRTITDEQGNKRNMISGPSTKHAIRDRVMEVTDKSNLCASCRIFSPLKNGKHTSNDDGLSKSGNRTKGCVVCDLMGFMNPTIAEKRHSVIRVSDAIAEVTGTREAQLHSRLDSASSAMSKVDKKKSKVDDLVTENGEAASSNMLFHEENRNSTYHQVVKIDLSRIAFDDENQQYVTFDKAFIKSRVRDAITAVTKHFLDVQGAKVSVHTPHLMSLSGVITEKTDGSQISTTYSTMNADYLAVKDALNANNVAFSNPAEFKDAMTSYLDDAYLDFMIDRNIAYVEQTFHA